MLVWIQLHLVYWIGHLIKWVIKSSAINLEYIQYFPESCQIHSCILWWENPLNEGRKMGTWCGWIPSRLNRIPYNHLIKILEKCRMPRIIMQQLSKNSSVVEKLFTIYHQVGNSGEQGPQTSDTVLPLCCTFINSSKTQKAWSSRQKRWRQVRW